MGVTQPITSPSHPSITPAKAHHFTSLLHHCCTTSINVGPTSAHVGWCQGLFSEPVMPFPLFFDMTWYIMAQGLAHGLSSLSISLFWHSSLPCLSSYCNAWNDIPMGTLASSPPPNLPTLANTHGGAPKWKLVDTTWTWHIKDKEVSKRFVPAWSKKGKRPSGWHLRNGRYQQIRGN